MLNVNVVIVLYNSNINRLLKLVDTILSSNRSIFVTLVDNGSDNSLLISEVLINFNRIKFIFLNENKGIAYAQNQGIQFSLDNKFEYILFFDQDSNIDESFITNLYTDYLSINDTQKACIGPRFIDENKGFYFPALKFNNYGLIKKINVENIDEPIKVSCLISSGSLVSVKILSLVGLMKDEFFIDYVDTEWCFRALSQGYTLYMSKNAVMKHSIGDDTIQLFNFKIPVHSGFRRYFRIRNLFFMWKLSYIPKTLTLKLMITNFLHQILLILLKKNKFSYIKFYLKAIKDGVIQSKNYHD